MNKFITSFIFVAFLLLLTSCAPVQPNAHACMTGHTYGFFGGLWHGMIAPFAWIISLFNDNVTMWAANNNGGWYTFGFLLGIGALGGGTVKASK